MVTCLADGSTAKAQIPRLCSAIVPPGSDGSTANTPKFRGFEFLTSFLKPFEVYKHLTHAYLMEQEFLRLKVL
ncbi:hypothetical protein B296_00049380 [Ensete ventricosum]|uniref:Uncharacterized protein n=1 Tax=Ensete ventricosum TaxID=4639 RepID=A0A426YQZ6_ENSVE|nr:hypothetical protein B296_00049380 [Ensete ventricosum]